MKEKAKRGKLFLILAIIFLLLAAGIILLEKLGFFVSNKDFGTVAADSLVTVDFDTVPQNTLYITRDREEYRTGLMRLVIPKIGLDTPIGENTLPNDLEEMPGLYEFSQMPSDGDVNVSIAGHRDIGHREFYALDKVFHDDFMYLIYQDTIYKYAYYSSAVVAPDNWEVIKRQGFSALTLTTCDPIGTRLNRLIVVGQLTEIVELTEDYKFV